MIHPMYIHAFSHSSDTWAILYSHAGIMYSGGLTLTALTRMPGGLDESVEKAFACSSARRLTPIFDTAYAA